MEYVTGLVPCALCLAQRAMFALIGVACLLYMFPFYASRLIFAGLSLIASGLGIWLASRQLWLQSLPEDQVPACGPDIYFMIERFPLAESLQTMLLGSGSCAEVQWTFLSLSIPGWTLLFYVLTTLISIYLMTFRGPRPFRLFNG
jgi:disulfide bond formation protein DsbB